MGDEYFEKLKKEADDRVLKMCGEPLPPPIGDESPRMERDEALYRGSLEVPRPDNWRHRSKSMACRTCMWYIEKNKSIGRCRRHAPTISGWPVMFPTDFCGDHKMFMES
jgi:hypothetical protein